MLRLSTIVALLFAFNLYARDWVRLPIPDAYCGDGLQYSVFLDRRSNSQWAFELMGGGACWSTATCWGPNLRTWIHPIPEIPQYSVLTTESSVLADHSMVYFPYCTGDVYSGTHTGKYGLGAKVKHHGATNISKTLNHLVTLGFLKPNQIEDLVVYGSSAGAIGSLFHTQTFDKLLGSRSKQVQKRVIADSPGLHFGKDFWHKFTPEQMQDFQNIFAGIGVFPDFKDGLVAPYIRQFCDLKRDWQVAFLQSTKDPIMSLVFGGLSMRAHRRLLLGEDGLPASLVGSENCSYWGVDKPGHTFLVLPLTAAWEDGLSMGQDALSFVNDFLGL